MAAVLVTAEMLAKELGVSPPAVAQAKKSGRLTVISTPQGDRFDLAVARIQWEANRKRQPARPESASPPESGPQSTSTGEVKADGSDYWSAKTKREQAEASIAELKLAEMAGELVRRDPLERMLFGAARVMRDQLLALAPRLSASVAPMTDPKAIELKVAEEIRVALRAFAQQLRSGGYGEAADGVDR